MTGERGQKNVNRPELVEKYGFDTKHAGHMVGLGFQGIEHLETGYITLPMPEDHRSVVTLRASPSGVLMTTPGRFPQAGSSFPQAGSSRLDVASPT